MSHDNATPHCLVLGCLLALPGIGFLFAGGGLVLTFGVNRDPAGYPTSGIIDVSPPTSAVVAKNVGVVVDAATPDWVLSGLDAAAIGKCTWQASAGSGAIGSGVRADDRTTVVCDDRENPPFAVRDAG